MVAVAGALWNLAAAETTVGEARVLGDAQKPREVLLCPQNPAKVLLPLHLWSSGLADGLGVVINSQRRQLRRFLQKRVAPFKVYCGTWVRA
jgi:hypothetical protein